MKNILKIISVIAVLLILAFAVYASLNKNSTNKYNLPEEALNNPKLKEAYIFAIENPDILEKYPCYCGCENMGHRNNKDCYYDENGNLEEHATLCGGCVGTTLDIKRMTEEGKTDEEILDYINENYAPPV